MNNAEKNHIGIAQSLRQKFEQHRLPRLLKLKEKVDNGNAINDADFDLLCIDIKDANLAMHMMVNYPALQAFCLQMGHLYKEICDQAVANESR